MPMPPPRRRPRGARPVGPQEVGVGSPTQSLVEAFGALDMEHIRETLVGPERDQALKEASMLLARATALRAYAGRLGQGREGTPAGAAGSVTG